MDDDGWSTQRLLSMRRFTRAVADYSRERLTETIQTLRPLFRPRSVLGDHVASSSKQAVKGADQAFRKLHDLYATVASGRPFNLEPTLESPIELADPDLELAALTYLRPVATGSGERTINVTAPLRWVLSYQGYGLERLRSLLAQAERPAAELRALVLHTLVMHVVVTSQPGLQQILARLQCPIGVEPMPGLGDLPISIVGSSLATRLPPDRVIVDSTEISGADAFEEILDPADVHSVQDEYQARLQDIARAHHVAGAPA